MLYKFYIPIVSLYVITVLFSFLAIQSVMKINRLTSAQSMAKQIKVFTSEDLIIKNTLNISKTLRNFHTNGLWFKISIPSSNDIIFPKKYQNSIWSTPPDYNQAINSNNAQLGKLLIWDNRNDNSLMYTFFTIILTFGLIVLIYLYFALLNFFKEINYTTAAITSNSSSESLTSVKNPFFREVIRLYNEKRKQQDLIQKSILVSQLSSQVAHDIRSPLAALDMALEDLDSIPDDNRMIVRGAVSRIHDISNDLLSKNRNRETDESSKRESSLISTVVSNIVTEKRTQYRTRSKIQLLVDFKNSYGLFSTINRSEFERVISNILDNAYESIEESGKIKISIYKQDNMINIKVWNNGRIIPSHILEKIGEKGISYGKENGNGLGVYHAKKIIECLGGSIKYTSNSEELTTVLITLPKAEPPLWYISQLSLREGNTIIVMDDDLSIHNVWDGRLTSTGIKNKVNLVNFTSPESLISWHKDCHKNDFIYLIDYEYIGFDTNGIDLIEKLGIESQSILVTSRYDEQHIKNKATTFRGLIPKFSAVNIPIVLNR